jgi:hypothetical protein
VSLYLDRLARVVPPRAGATVGAGAPRAVACNAATTSFELDTDIFQLPLQNNASGGGVPGSYGRALVRFHAESNDLWILFGSSSSVTANSAATSGNTVCAHIPANQDRDFELDPSIDKWCSATTQNGQSYTATLRYQIVSYPTRSQNT